MPPTQSTPSRSAFSSRSSSPSRAKMPSCGNAVTWIVQRSASSSRTRSSPRTIASFSPETSACARMKSVPCATDQRTISRARSKTSCSVRLGFSSPQTWMPSISVPRLVPARLAGGERRVEMQVAVDERRRDEPSFRVDLLARRRPRATRRSASSGRPRRRGRRAGPSSRRALRTTRSTRASLRGAEPGDERLRLRPYGSRAATRSGRRACRAGSAGAERRDAHRHRAGLAHERLPRRRPARSTPEVRLRRHAHTAGHDAPSRRAAGVTWSGPTSRGVGGPAATRLGSPHEPRSKRRTRAGVRSSTWVRPRGVDDTCPASCATGSTASCSGGATSQTTPSVDQPTTFGRRGRVRRRRPATAAASRWGRPRAAGPCRPTGQRHRRAGGHRARLPGDGGRAVRGRRPRLRRRPARRPSRRPRAAPARRRLRRSSAAGADVEPPRARRRDDERDRRADVVGRQRVRRRASRRRSRRTACRSASHRRHW